MSEIGFVFRTGATIFVVSNSAGLKINKKGNSSFNISNDSAFKLSQERNWNRVIETFARSRAGMFFEDVTLCVFLSTKILRKTALQNRFFTDPFGSIFPHKIADYQRCLYLLFRTLFFQFRTPYFRTESAITNAVFLC